MNVRYSALVFLSASIFLVGCTSKSPESAGVPVMTDGLEHGHDHDHGEGHGGPETLADAVHEMTELRDVIRDAFAENDGEAAHGPLHEIGHILEEVSSLASNADLTDEAKKTVESNIESLLNDFGAVDKKMHSSDENEGSDYQDVKETIDTAIAAITEAVAPAIKDADHDHDHKDGDHDHDHDEKKTPPKDEK